VKGRRGESEGRGMEEKGGARPQKYISA